MLITHCKRHNDNSYQMSGPTSGFLHARTNQPILIIFFLILILQLDLRVFVSLPIIRSELEEGTLSGKGQKKIILKSCKNQKYIQRCIICVSFMHFFLLIVLRVFFYCYYQQSLILIFIIIFISFTSFKKSLQEKMYSFRIFCFITKLLKKF